jgi:hypothetical protein
MNAWLRNLWPKRSPKRPRFGTARPQLESLEERRLLTTYTVTNVLDGGPGSLRQAILSANAHPGQDTIAFNIPGAGAHTIRVGSTTGMALPDVTDPVDINGLTQPGFTASPLIELTGPSGPMVWDGLRILAGSSSVEGLAINGFNNAGIELAGAGGNTLVGNYIGPDPSGTRAPGNTTGVLVSGSPNNAIGPQFVLSGAPFSGNVISGNGTAVQIVGSTATGNMVLANRIGTTAAGNAALGNKSGVEIVRQASGTLVASNIIAGAAGSGVYIAGGGNTVRSNYVGTDLTGSVALGNAFGVIVASGVGNVIGGTDPVYGNVISGNGVGVQLLGGTSTSVLQNRIGTNAAGTAAVPNQDGVCIDGSSGNLIGNVVYVRRVFPLGWTRLAEGNLISGNRGDGVRIMGGAAHNQVLGNLIGTQADGVSRLGNGGNGVHVTGAASNNQIGSLGSTGLSLFPVPPGGNTIAYNGGDGVFVESGTGNSILSNSIYASGGKGIHLGVPLMGNNLQPAPDVFGALSSTSFQGPNAIYWDLAGFRANTTYTVQFFDGKVLLGTITVTTDASGFTGLQTFVSGLPLATGDWITATATDPSGNTSEFAAGTPVRDFYF